MTNKRRKYFCSLPFSSLMSFNTGHVKPCCDSLNFASDKTLSLSEIWNSEKWNKLRENILNDVPDPNCSVCWKKEEKNIMSGRDYSPLRYHMLERCDPDGKINSPPTSLSLRLGNKCNLKCIMCSPVNSTKWHTDYSIYKKFFPKINVDLTEDLLTLDKISDDFFDNVETLKLIGGEPLILKSHRELLDKLINKNLAQNITLNYFSNTILLPDWCKDYWSHFKKIEFVSSIDGYEESYNYIRFPGDWKQVETNIKKLNSWNLNNFDYSIFFVLMNVNIFELEKLFIWRSQFPWQIDMPEIRPDYIEEPYFFRPQYLPPEVKKSALSSLDKILKNYCVKPRDSRFITDLIKRTQAQPKDLYDHFDELKSYLNELDKSRGTNYKEVFNYIFK